VQGRRSEAPLQEALPQDSALGAACAAGELQVQYGPAGKGTPQTLCVCVAPLKIKD